jgi:hypothetical protein
VWDKLTAELKKRTGWDAQTFFSRPELYHGIAPAKASALAAHYETAMQTLKEELS